MPSIPLTAQTHSGVSGEGHLGKNKVSLTESSAGHEKPDGFVFPPPMSQCLKQGRAIFKTSTMWKKWTWKWVWVVLFIYCTTHLYTQKMLIYSWRSRQHTPEGSQTQAPLFCFDFLWVQAIAAESTHWQQLERHTTSWHTFMGSWHDIFTVLNEKSQSFSLKFSFGWTAKKYKFCPVFFFFSKFRNWKMYWNNIWGSPSFNISGHEFKYLTNMRKRHLFYAYLLFYPRDLNNI